MNLALVRRQQLPEPVRDDLDRIVAGVNAMWDVEHDPVTGTHRGYTGTVTVVTGVNFGAGTVTTQTMVFVNGLCTAVA